MKKLYTRLMSLLLCLILILNLNVFNTYAAVDWPSDLLIESEGGIVIDSDTGAVLYGKNIHEPYFPASITKILTALIVIENSNLDDMVTFSRNAVYNVESGSSNMAMDTGDQLSVRDCLYGLMLKSANECANALAEHVAGSIDAFADMMNKKAESLGCKDSHFANPSGLNNPDHYTSAYDMALIAKAAFSNPTFVEIDSATYHKIPASQRAPEGQTVYAHHAMLKKNDSRYYSGIIGGKTGYTSLAGNTLVTCAQRNNMKLIAVILNGHQTHYSDTKTLLDFGFNNFQSVKVADYDKSFSNADNDMVIAGFETTDLSAISLDKSCKITLPKAADFSDATSEISYNLTESDPANAIAKIQYSYNDRAIGTAYLTVDQEKVSLDNPLSKPFDTTETLPETQTETQAVTKASQISETEAAVTVAQPEHTNIFASIHIPPVVWISVLAVIAVIVIITIIILVKNSIEKREALERAARKERRLKRLEDINISQSDFDSLVEERRRSSYTAKKPSLFSKLFKRNDHLSFK